MSSGRAILLGCGTSTGVPLIGCKCNICTSLDPRNKRLRASLWVELNGVRLLVDTSPDLRQQALENNLPGVDAVLFTHTHADHVHGMDDLRMFNFLQRTSITCYAPETELETIASRFAYIFRPEREYPSAIPRLEIESMPAELMIGDARIVAVPIRHGSEDILGYRFGDLAYLTDISELPDSSRQLLAGVESLIIGGLRHTPHPTHMTVAEAVDTIERIAPSRAFLTHMSHDLDYQVLANELPEGVMPGYDGLTIEIGAT